MIRRWRRRRLLRKLRERRKAARILLQAEEELADIHSCLPRQHQHDVR